jgi:hypothetical protein
VGSVLVVPVEHYDQLGSHGFTPRGNYDPLQRFLDRPHGSFQNGNTAMFAESTETGPNPLDGDTISLVSVALFSLHAQMGSTPGAGLA